MSNALPTIANPPVPNVKSLLETISFLANHAVTAGAPEPIPPFSYGKQKADPINQIYPMTPGNSAPGLVVWLYMVTSNKFLDELETPTGPNGSFNPENLPFDDIVKHTNLTQDAIRSIFDCYLNDGDSQQMWRHVVSRFQDFAGDHSLNYVPDGCPNTGILALAATGAAVNPNALAPPPLS
jgi:hypothetical protein